MGGVFDFMDLSPFSSTALHAFEQFLCGPLKDRTDARRRASPLTYVTSNSPPLLLVHSDIDPIAPYSGARLMERRYRETGAHVELITVPGAPHEFWNYTRWFPTTIEQCATFLRRVAVDTALGVRPLSPSSCRPQHGCSHNLAELARDSRRRDH